MVNIREAQISVLSLKNSHKQRFRYFFSYPNGSSCIIPGLKNPSLGTSSVYTVSVSKFLILCAGPTKEDVW